jgi:hypothetical protein
MAHWWDLDRTRPRRAARTFAYLAAIFVPLVSSSYGANSPPTSRPSPASFDGGSHEPEFNPSRTGDLGADSIGASTPEIPRGSPWPTRFAAVRVHSDSARLEVKVNEQFMLRFTVRNESRFPSRPGLSARLVVPAGLQNQTVHPVASQDRCAIDTARNIPCTLEAIPAKGTITFLATLVATRPGTYKCRLQVIDRLQPIDERPPLEHYTAEVTVTAK